MDYRNWKPGFSSKHSSKLIGTSVAAAIAMLFGSGAALALNTGTDMNLAYKPASGGMGGAGYARPQDVSSAIFGNPATLTQMKGFNGSLAASLMSPDTNVTHTNGAFSNKSSSTADNYVIPDFALGQEIMPGTVMGFGVEVDAGLGGDYRTNPVTAGPGGAIKLPLVVELLSFNANLALAKEITPQLSVGGAVTIGFGLAQLGTTGPTSGITAVGGLLGLPITDFGGTSSSVHNISYGGSVGLTYKATPALTLSGAVKSPVKYKFHNIVFADLSALGGPKGYQNLTIEQPLELVAGAAFDVNPNWLVEADVVWKNWSNATTYQDVYKDQFLLLLGTQYKTGPWSLRAGYSHAQKLQRDQPNGTLGGLAGLGTLPLNTAVPGVLNQNDIVRLVQMTLTPVIWQNTITGGVGYDITPHVRVDGYGGYAFKEEANRATLLLGNYKFSATSQWSVGAGINFRF